MGLDQSQEHSIQFLKQDTGSKGLYGDTSEKLTIELSKAGVLRLFEEYKIAIQGINPEDKNIEHAEASLSEQNTYLNYIQELLKLVQKNVIIDPFKDTDDQLVTLDTGES